MVDFLLLNTIVTLFSYSRRDSICFLAHRFHVDKRWTTDEYGLEAEGFGDRMMCLNEMNSAVSVAREKQGQQNTLVL